MEDIAAPVPRFGCPFCQPRELELILAETPSFYLLADHAPFVGGHLLSVPRAHYACYGTIPPQFDAELLELKESVRRFLNEVYRAPTFFEHGIFRQTVFHAHLHAMPFGPLAWDLLGMAEPSGGVERRSQDDLRAWYTQRGHYFYLESPGDPAQSIAAQAAIFPPEMGVYGRALTKLHQLANDHGGWSPPQLRYATRGPKLRALAEAWNAWRAQAE
jgi:diadenosine tetraphosphate (Ap4A) HIT family hydrolase